MIDTLTSEVKREPRRALDGGLLCRDPGGALVVEHGFDQADAFANGSSTPG